MKLPKSRKIGYSYIRFSTPEQAEGDSLRRQLDATLAWCEKNGVTLDTSKTYTDAGVTAFTGQHRDNPDKYALASFLQLVREGGIEPDSYLIVENLDRLTREHLRPAVRFVLELLDEHRINIVTTNPERVFRHDSQDMVDIIIAVVELSRGHGESQRKSEMVGAAWREKKRGAVEELTPLTAMCPHWLEVVDGEYRKIPDRVKLVQRIFKLAAEDTGVGAICRKLNLEGVAPFGKVRRKRDRDKPHLWQKSSVGRLLSNPAVYGMYQPHVGHRVRKPVGEPVLLYPVVVTEELYWKAQAAMKGRKQSGGRERTRAKNLFTSIVRDQQGYRWVVDNKGGGKLNLANVPGVMKGEEYQSVPYDVFERVVLDHLHEIDPAELLPSGDRGQEAARLTASQDKLDGAKEKVRVFEQKVFDDYKNTTWPVLLDRAKAELEEAQAEYQEARRAVATPVVETMGEVRTLIGVLRKNPTEETRGRLRARIASVVSEMVIEVSKDGPYKNVGVLVKFKNPEKNLITAGPGEPLRPKGYQRAVMFRHRPARRGRGYEYPEELKVGGAIDMADDLDLKFVDVQVGK